MVKQVANYQRVRGYIPNHRATHAMPRGNSIAALTTRNLSHACMAPRCLQPCVSPALGFDIALPRRQGNALARLFIVRCRQFDQAAPLRRPSIFRTAAAAPSSMRRAHRRHILSDRDCISTASTAAADGRLRPPDHPSTGGAISGPGVPTGGRARRRCATRHAALMARGFAR